ncbi:HAD-IA family hydrolase [Phycisphaerales bacterium AB-hyl4]|uniref:HAD-IA family hydrolase n=1 Tax=Natronomicrosphaera hydrolytica TaxID=3242702 RepID=A0ABV4TZX6_9BACT
MTQQGNIELVCFDLGRVLIRIVDDWSDACERAGVPIDEAWQAEATRRQLAELGQQHETGALACEQYFERSAAVAGLTSADVRQVSTAWLCEPFAGLEALLDALAAARVRTACLSNTNAHHWAMMYGRPGPCRLPLDRLDYRFASHLLGVAKPSPAIYEHVEQATSIAAERILFFDDLPANVAAAAERGWQAVQVTDRDDPLAQVSMELERRGVLRRT